MEHMPMSIRIPENELAVIDEAATLTGDNRSQFVRSAAVKLARAIVSSQIAESATATEETP